MKNKKLAKICAGALVLGVVASGSVLAASAADLTTSSTTTSVSAISNSKRVKATKYLMDKVESGKMRAGKGNPGSMIHGLESAVTANIITQAESDSITTFVKENKKEVKDGLFAALVEKEVLTQEKADALQTYLSTQREQSRQEKLETAVADLVTDNTVIQAQADKIIATVSAAQSARKTAYETAKTMTKDEAKAFLDAFKEDAAKPLTALVADGTITQEQADEIASVIYVGRGHENRDSKGRNVQQGGNMDATE